MLQQVILRTIVRNPLDGQRDVLWSQPPSGDRARLFQAAQRRIQPYGRHQPPLHRTGVRTQEKHDVDLHDRVQAHPHAGPQQRIYGQGSLRKLQITERIRNTQLPDHGRDNPYDAVRERRPHLTTCQGHVFV